ncbi:MAG: 50S ribosomal protein L4 [Patescibacteria group bacterium]
MHMETTLYNQEGQSIGTVSLNDAVFNAPMNRDLLHQVVTAYEANKRQVIAHAKGRSEVRGGGKKPWQQKGTGRARHGSIRSPLWKGGGVTFGPTKERDFSKKINKSMARKALTVALSEKLRVNALAVVDNITLPEVKTKHIAKTLAGIAHAFGDHARGSLLMVIPSVKSHGGLVRASRNLPVTKTIEVRNINARDVLAYRHIVVLQEALPTLGAARART